MWNTISGTRQFYTDSENKDGIPIVFIHGFPFDHSSWQGQVNILPSRFRAITYDVRGHGQSEPGTMPYSLEFLTDDLLALVEKLQLRRPILCGLSMGGYIALRATERWPDLFRAFILCDTRSEADTNQAKINRAAAIKTIQNLGVGKYASDSVGNLFWDEHIKNQIPAVGTIRGLIEKTSPEVLCATLMALAARTDTREFLENIKAATLILVGEHDKITPPIAAESLHENIKGSELVVLKNAGHLSNLENPEDFNLALLKFLSEVE